MKQRASVILKIEAGNLRTMGFPFTMQILGNDQIFAGQLPPAPELPDRFEQWRELANNLGHRVLITTPTTQVTNVDIVDDCHAAAIALETAINHWLGQGSVMNSLFVPLFRALPEAPGLKLFIQTSDPLLQRLPWQVWQLLTETYPDVEVILSAALRPSAVRFKLPVRILAIEGDTSGTNANLDLGAIERIPGIQVTPLKQPTKEQLQDCLWDESWDILLFMGHSRSQGRTGEIALNADETPLSFDELHETFKYSAKNGLKLAIFNSCDGVGIASKLADLRIPYTIAMREPIPDVIAQSFLQTLLKQFAQRKSLHESVSVARRKLQENQGRFPCAAWLPVIYQNPAAPDMRFPRVVTIGRRWKYFWLGVLAFVLAILSMLYPNYVYMSRTSLGDRLLSQCSLTHQADLKNAPAAFAAKDYDRAVQHFQDFLNRHECPEITIYANNATIRSSNTPTIGRIAASVPIGGNNPGTAEQMLKGIAEAQKKAIQQGMPIEVMIVADGNDPNLMKTIASKVVRDQEIAAVIGPNASNAVAVAAKYYFDKLVMVTPTAFFEGSNGRGKSAYRILPSPAKLTAQLSNYAKKLPGKIAICADERSPDNDKVADSFREQLPKEMRAEINPCISDRTDFPVISTALRRDDIKGILLAPHIEHIQEILEIARDAKKIGLKLFGTSTFYADNILTKENAETLAGMVFYTPWSPSLAGTDNPFRSQLHTTWRTAASYDAFGIVSEGLNQALNAPETSTRQNLRNVFQEYKKQKIYQGITGAIQFDDIGTRVSKLDHEELLEIKQVKQAQWQFCPVKRSAECPPYKAQS